MESSGGFVSCRWLCDLIASQMAMPAEQVHPQMRLVGELGIDSLELQSLLLAIEDRVGVIPDGPQLQRVITVSDLHALVLRLIETKRS
jgi:acyl carrier protein